MANPTGRNQFTGAGGLSRGHQLANNHTVKRAMRAQMHHQILADIAKAHGGKVVIASRKNAGAATLKF